MIDKISERKAALRAVRAAQSHLAKAAMHLERAGNVATSSAFMKTIDSLEINASLAWPPDAIGCPARTSDCGGVFVKGSSLTGALLCEQCGQPVAP